jgi:hypothetical protein
LASAYTVILIADWPPNEPRQRDQFKTNNRIMKIDEKDD